MGGFGQEAVSKATLQRSFTLKRKRNGVVAGRGYGTRKVLQFYQVGEILTAHLSAGNDSTENNSSATQEWVYDLKHYLGGGERDWAPVHSGRDRKRSVMTTRVRQGCGRRGPCAGGGPDSTHCCSGGLWLAVDVFDRLSRHLRASVPRAHVLSVKVHLSAPPLLGTRVQGLFPGLGSFSAICLRKYYPFVHFAT